MAGLITQQMSMADETIFFEVGESVEYGISRTAQNWWFTTENRMRAKSVKRLKDP